MANRVKLSLSGVRELRHAIQQYGQALVDAAVDEVTDATEDTALKARFLAPVGRYTYPPNSRAQVRKVGGTLRDSITAAVKTDGYGVHGMVRARAPHAHLVELGTRHSAKRPYLLPVAIRNRRRLNQRLRDAIIRLAPADLGTPRVTGEGPSTPDVSVS